MSEIPDRLVKTVTLRAPRERVWRAISDSRQFGAWFGCDLPGPFTAGAHIVGTIAPTQVDPEVATMQEPHRGKPFEITIERVEPMTRLSFRWHPFAIEPGHDYASEPTTLVELVLADADGGAATELTITESGFAGIPLARRAAAFTANAGGWAHQCRLVQRYVER
jgi:uncharacterized protein YndB with AHSA1/START domain|nr:SRPBCC family protein [Kofleriaceae bacterium]